MSNSIEGLVQQVQELTELTAAQARTIEEKDAEIALLKAALASAESDKRKLADMVEIAIYAAPQAQAPVAAIPVEWTPGPNELKDWCTQYFGPDADDTYLAEAVFNLPPMARRFKTGEQPSAWWRYSYIEKDGSHDLDMYYGPNPLKHYVDNGHPWNPLYDAPQQHAQPDLTCVIHWLEGGCDPMDAAKELRAYQKKMGLPDVPVIPAQQHAQAPDLTTVICWVEDKNEGLCQAVEQASDIKDPYNAFVRLSAVLKLLGGQQHAQAAQPIVTVPGGVQALADITGQSLMYGDHEVKPLAQPIAWELPPLPSYDSSEDFGFSSLFTADHMRTYGHQCRAAALELAEKACEAIAQDHRDQYKGRGKHAPNNPRRADPHADGCFDGANECADAIRALNKKEGL